MTAYDSTEYDPALWFALAATNEGKLDDELAKLDPVHLRFVETVANLMAERAFIVRLRKERAA